MSGLFNYLFSCMSKRDTEVSTDKDLDLGKNENDNGCFTNASQASMKSTPLKKPRLGNKKLDMEVNKKSIFSRNKEEVAEEMDMKMSRIRDSHNPDLSKENRQSFSEVKETKESRDLKKELIGGSVVTVHNHSNNSFQRKSVLLSPKKIISTKYLIFNEISNIEELNNLKLIEEYQHDYNIKKKAKKEEEEKIVDEEIPMDFVNLNVDIMKKDIKSTKKILIQDEEGELFWKKELIIEPFGMRNGLRLKRDGYTFFGSERRALETLKWFSKRKAKIPNDFIINYDITDQAYENLFFTYFDRNTQGYSIKVIHGDINKEKYCLYFQLNERFAFEQGIKFLAQDCIFVVEVDQIVKTRIHLSFFFGKEKETYTFNPEDSPVSIGRSKKCKVYLNYSFLSKVHCTLTYDIKYNPHWEIMDGDSEKIRSTNGTWVNIENSYDITQWTNTFKLGNKTFNITLF